MKRIDGPHLGNGIKFAIVFIVVNLHIVRNLSTIGYLAVYVPVALYVTAQYSSSAKHDLLEDRGILFWLWILVGFMAFFVSLLIISPSGAATGLARFLFASPVFMAFSLYTRDTSDLLKHIRVMVVFFALASWTLPMQFVVGPVSWFSEASTRAGLERYASLIGSLTSIGIIVGCYLLLVQMLPRASKYVWLCLIALPAISSLSKAAIINVAFGAMLVLYLNRRSLIKVFVAAVLCSLVGLFVAQEMPMVTARLTASLESFGFSGGNSGIVNYDRSVDSSIWDRVTSLPLANIDALHDLHSPLVYAVGGGYGMGSTALVPEADAIAPMAHNQFAESFSVFGIVGGGIQFFIVTVVALRLYRRYRFGREPLYLITLCVYGLLLVNSVFANGTIYQPSSASIFFLSLFIATSKVVGRRVLGERAQKIATLEVDSMDEDRILPPTRQDTLRPERLVAD